MSDIKENLFCGPPGQQREPGDICIVAFAASQDVFQFGRLLERLELPHVLMRDSSLRWYQDGIAGIGDRAAVAAYLRDLAHGYHVKTIGASSGAYAALLYGKLAQIHEIIAISPVTTITEISDIPAHWHHRLAPNHPFAIDDLKMVFADGTNPPVRAFVTDDDLDVHMVRRLGIEPTLISGHQHSTLARHMRDCGLLATLLKEREP